MEDIMKDTMKMIRSRVMVNMFGKKEKNI